MLTKCTYFDVKKNAKMNPKINLEVPLRTIQKLISSRRSDINIFKTKKKNIL